VAISTDKAVEPLNIYGATKMAMERLFIEADRESWDTHFTVVRYGNVIGSTGSVIPRFAQQALEDHVITITDKRMTRFWLTADEAVDIVLHAILEPAGECIVIPHARAMTLIGLVDALFSGVEYEVIGVRPGEKLHESLLSAYEAPKATQSYSPRYIYYNPLNPVSPGNLTSGIAPMTSDTAPLMSATDMVAAVELAEEI
jgi:UDP-N-acetylglucosamine 4,6-dehydratase/5-epimerase